jgi:hypothetical protein
VEKTEKLNVPYTMLRDAERLQIEKKYNCPFACPDIWGR